MKNYCSYIRVSTPRQGERGVSLQEQREAISRYATRFSITVSTWFEEQQTAAKRGRPVWNRMLKLLRKGEAAGVIMHKIDRSARNLKDWADLGDLIDQGVEVHFANEALDLNSRGGRLSADIQAVVAADYIRNLREEAKKGIYGRLKQGYYPMMAPLGYVDHGAGKPKTIDPIQGPLVRRAFELYASGRYTYPTLSDVLFRLGLRNRVGGRITRNGLSTLLNNPFYMGVMRIRRTGERFLGNHEPLITKQLFDKVQAVLRGRFATRRRVHEFLFRRLIRCKLCGYSAVAETRKGHVYYRCHTEDCPTTAVREEYVSAIVEGSLKRLQFSQQEKDRLSARIQHLEAHWMEEQEKHLATVRIQLQQVNDRLKRLTDAYLDQAIDRATFDERNQAVLVERQTFEHSLAQLERHPEAVPEKLRKFLGLAEDAYSLYKRAEPAKKRDLLKILSSDMTLERKTLDFTYAQPFQVIAMRALYHSGGPSKDVYRTLDDLITSLVPSLEKYAPDYALLPEKPLN